MLAAVAAAPPKCFAGGGYWEAMHGSMSGWYEIRIDGPKRNHYRLFCLLDYEGIGNSRPLLVVIDGRSKQFMATLPESDYIDIRSLGEEYLARNPRSLNEGGSS